MFELINTLGAMIIILWTHKSHDYVHTYIRYKEEKEMVQKSFEKGNFPLKYHEKDFLTPVEARFRRKRHFGPIIAIISAIISSFSGLTSSIDPLSPIPPSEGIIIGQNLFNIQNLLERLDQQKDAYLALSKETQGDWIATASEVEQLTLQQLKLM